MWFPGSLGRPKGYLPLSPAFDSATLEYSTEMGNQGQDDEGLGGDMAQITLRPTASDAEATIAYLDANDVTIADADAAADDHQVDLTFGVNTIKIAVSKGTLTTTYTIWVTRAPYTEPTSTGDLPIKFSVYLYPYNSVEQGEFDGEVEVWMRFDNLAEDGAYTLRADLTGADECESSGIGVDHSISGDGAKVGIISSDCRVGKYTLVASITSTEDGRHATVSHPFKVVREKILILTSPGVNPCDSVRGMSEDPNLPEGFLFVFMDMCSAQGMLGLGTPGVYVPPSMRSAPTDLTATLSETGITLTWTASEISDITGYSITREEYTEGNIFHDKVWSTTSNAETTYHHNRNIEAGWRYVYRVKARNDVGFSPASEPAEITVPVPPVLPVEFSAKRTQEGTPLTVTMEFSNFESNDDSGNVEYYYRADVVTDPLEPDIVGGIDVNQCEGNGLGAVHTVNLVGGNPETRVATITGDCPEGNYDLNIRVWKVEGGEETPVTTASPGFAIIRPGLGASWWGGASALDITVFYLVDDGDSSTRDYVFSPQLFTSEGTAADQCEGSGLGVVKDIHIFTPVENSWTTSFDEGRYTDHASWTGRIDADCPAGKYVFTLSVSWGTNGEYVETFNLPFTVTPPETPRSGDATLSGLTLSGVDIGEFDPATFKYAASVPNDVAETTVIPTTNDDGAAYLVEFDGLADYDGVIPLSVGSNVIIVQVVAEAGQFNAPLRTYTVTVTRAEAPAEPSNDATLSSLTLSGVTLAFDPATTRYTAAVGNDVTQTTVTAAANHAGATYAIKLDGAADADGVIPLAVGKNEIGVVVTAEDGETTRTYTVSVIRAEAPPEAEATVDLSPSGPVTEGTEVAVTMTFTGLALDSEANLVFRADVVDADACEGEGIGVDRNMSKVDEDSETRTGTISTACPAGDYTLTVSLTDDGMELASASASFSVVEPEPADEPSSPPDAPDKPAGQLTGPGQVLLDWNDVEGAAYYQVRFCCGSADWVTLPTGGIEVVFDGSGAAVSNLPDYGIYYFSVRAGNGAGLSEWSDYLTLSNAD